MCGPSAQDDSFDRGPTAGTGLCFSAIDAMQLLEAARLAVGVAVIAQRAAAMSQSAAKNLLNGAA